MFTPLRSRLLPVAVLLVGLALLVSACGGGGRQQAGPAAQQSSTPAASNPPAAAPPVAISPPAPPASPEAREQPSQAPAQAQAPQPQPAATPSQPSPKGAAGSGETVVVASDEGGRFRFEPNVLEVRRGQQVSLRVVNRGPSPHDLSIPDLKVDTGQFNSGEERAVTFRAPNRAGEYSFVCTVPGHAQLGMTGRLVVR